MRAVKKIPSSPKSLVLAMAIIKAAAVRGPAPSPALARVQIHSDVSDDQVAMSSCDIAILPSFAFGLAVEAQDADARITGPRYF